MAKKEKTYYVCTECGHDAPKWMGQCSGCKAWNTLKEFKEKSENINTERKKWVQSKYTEFTKGGEISSDYKVDKILTNISELDNVFGGGITIGSVNLISGEPGVGKSTLLTQTICALSERENAGYVSGEESLEQIRSRAKRIQVNDSEVYYLSETNIESVIEEISAKQIKIVVIDSIQTIYTDTSKSAAGSVSQIRESTGILTNFAKANNVTVLIVGHVTKDGEVAGPKVLEHIVDGVFQIEGDQNSRYRIMRAFKNRFGEANEVGIFAMTSMGMKAVSNPSAMFLSSNEEAAVGSSVVITKEGRRAIMYEIQSLVTSSDLEIPQRLTIGINHQRSKMMMAIMQKYLRTKTYKNDVYVSLVGGVQIQSEDTSSDLSLVYSLYSSMEDFIIPKDTCSFGEISLTGEVRPVPFSEERIKEAEKHGFKNIIVPKSNANKQLIEKYNKINIIPVKSIMDAIGEINKIKN